VSSAAFVFLHLLFVLMLAGGAIGGSVVRATARRVSDPRAKAMAAIIGWRLSAVLSIPGSLLAGLLGMHLVTARGYQFSQGWVRASLVLWLAVLLLSLVYLAPRAARGARLAKAFLADGSGERQTEFLAAISNPVPRMLADLVNLGLIALSWLMVMKPAF
jgi:uncharacterized membrane protein